MESRLKRGTTVTLTFPKDRRRRARRENISPGAVGNNFELDMKRQNDNLKDSILDVSVCNRVMSYPPRRSPLPSSRKVLTCHEPFPTESRGA